MDSIDSAGPRGEHPIRLEKGAAALSGRSPRPDRARHRFPREATSRLCAHGLRAGLLSGWPIGSPSSVSTSQPECADGHKAGGTATRSTRPPSSRAYFQEWSFRHPSTSDFFGVFERVSGQDLSTYLRHLVDGTSRLDWGVVTARSQREPTRSGLFDERGARVPYEDGKRVGSKRGGSTTPKGAAATNVFESEVLFGNRGEWSHGAKARLVFEDGRILDREIPAQARWVRWRVRYRSRLAWAAVDPERENAWDGNRLNDSRVLRKGKGAANTLGHRAVTKYFGWVSYLIGLFTQVSWALA